MRVLVALLLLAGPALASEPVPLRGQDVAQRARDTEACDKMAAAKSGYDPQAGGVIKEASRGAAAGGAAGVIAGNTTGGAAQGAIAGVAKQRANAQKQAVYDRERSACMIGRGYKLGG